MTASSPFSLGLDIFGGSAPDFSSGFGTNLLGGSSGASSSMAFDPLTLGLGLASTVGQGIFGNMAADKSARSARAAAKDAKKLRKEELRMANRLAGAQLGAQNLFADLDFARQGIAYDFQNQYNAFNPAARTNFRRIMQGNMFGSGASPGRIALAGKFMGFT